MMRRGLWLAGFFMLVFNGAFAQSFVESALLFSRTNPGGSARIQGLGGSQVALGGDFSSALSNPAGLGMYNRSEFTFSPAFRLSKTSADYLGQSTNDSKSTLHIPAFSLTFHNDYDKLSGFLNGTFAISYSRINDFNQNIKYQGTNSNNSIIDYFLEDATGATVSQFGANGSLTNTPTHLAYENYLIGDSTVWDPNADPTAYFTDVLGIPFQVEEIENRGAQNQWSFAYGTNFNDKLFLGVGLGVTTLKYKSKKVYTEIFENEPLLDLRLEENLEINGSGINATVGATFRPINMVQFAISATTPTRYELSDAYTAFMQTNWDNFQYDASTILNQEQYTSEVIASDYTLTTPGRINAGATLFLNKIGFVTADVERINYEKAKYSPITQGVSFDLDNEDIQNLYKTVYNIRGGFEFRYQNLRARAGYAYMPSPFKTDQNDVTESIQRITIGAGYRVSKAYIDLAVVHTCSERSYRPYSVNSPNSPLVTYKPRSTNIMFTVGLPF